MDNKLKFLSYIVLIFVSLLIIFIIYFLINIGNKYVDKSKKIHINNKKIFPILGFVILIYIIYLITKRYPILSEVFNIIIISIIFSYLLNPLVSVIQKRKISRFWSVLIVYLILIGILFIISFIIVPNVIQEFKKLIEVLPSYVNRASDFIDGIYNKYLKNIDNLPPRFQGLQDAILNNLNSLESVIIKTIKKFTDSILNIFSKLISIVTVPIITFYFLKDKKLFKKRLYLTIPKKHRKDTFSMFKQIDKVFSQFIRGRLIVAVFVGVTTTIVLFVLKINFAFIIGFTAGIADIIPYFGPVIGIIPAVFFALLESPIKALWVIILFTIIQQVENDIITPKIIGESIGVHPVSVILALIIGGGIFGVLGMILAVPAIGIIKIIFSFVIEKLNGNQVIDK